MLSVYDRSNYIGMIILADPLNLCLFLLISRTLVYTALYMIRMLVTSSICQLMVTRVTSGSQQPGSEALAPSQPNPQHPSTSTPAEQS